MTEDNKTIYVSNKPPVNPVAGDIWLDLGE